LALVDILPSADGTGRDSGLSISAHHRSGRLAEATVAAPAADAGKLAAFVECAIVAFAVEEADGVVRCPVEEIS
jgi:hypothetical protein